MAGGGSNKPVEGKKAARIEIIPLIDVIFFLLATFVLFTLTLNKLVSLPVELPKASVNNDSPQDKDMVTIQLSTAGTCYWNRELIDPDTIKDRLDHYKEQVPNPRVLITGDNAARFGPVVKVLDEVRLAHIEQVSIETQPRATGK